MDNLTARPQGAVPAQIVGRGAAACHAPVPIPVEVRTSTGRWIEGFRLEVLERCGAALIRSNYTGATRWLLPGQWRDPAEEEALAAIAEEERA